MGTLSDLTGTRKPLSAGYVRSVNAAINALKTKRAATSADDDGAINVWRDDKGRLRSNFCRYRATIDEQEHASVASLRRWLKAWWPRMTNFDVR